MIFFTSASSAASNHKAFRKKKCHLFLLDFQVNQSFQGNLSVQVVQALRGFLGHLGVQEDRRDRESCCGILREPGSASFPPWSSGLKEMKKLVLICLYINTPDPPTEISGRGRIALLTVDELLANLSCNGAHHVLGCKVSLETKRITC